ncbi:MAG: hypothetical protein RMJ37_03815 [Spirochaetia bacterium]|nr:hypothetical protein [Spirochaetota bacterium]MCX8096905.1 hypothetical protein [Spirochaetota bacterium]MDW8112454.1 hypothetical protein [Spirochaetia bacterium]
MGKLYNSLPNSFIKSVLEGENEELVEKLLENKKLFETEQDKDKKIMYKERFSSSFWEIYNEILLKIGTQWFDKTPLPKRLFIRFGILDLKYLSVEDQEMIKSVPLKKMDSDDDVYNSIYYVDEWIEAIGKGKIEASTTDELPKKRKKTGGMSDADKEKFERKRGILEAEMSGLKELLRRRQLLEETILHDVKRVHDFSRMFDEISENNYSVSYSQTEEDTLQKVSENVREVIRINKEINTIQQKVDKVLEEIRKIEATLVNNGIEEEYEVDTSTISTEIQTIRQMTKMCVGRQGNHFPVLTSSMLPRSHLKPNFRDNATQYIKSIWELDPEIFDRRTRSSQLKIVPYFILTIGYGNYGICWEPFNKFNKISSKGRIAIPIFSRNPKEVIVIGLGDFRWNMAKEMAGYHWMEEGLTGDYYQYHDSIKWKGDLRSKFIYDYYLWIMKESEGIQKLEKEVRRIFWFKIPFPDKLKEELSKKGYYYQDLYKKEETKKQSGY